MKTNPNDPIAYVDELQAIEGSEEYNRFVNYGLTKREYFAAMAMQGLLAAPKTFPDSNSFFINCEVAVKFADTLIETLNDEADNQKGDS
jgi:hypothetical protein